MYFKKDFAMNYSCEYHNDMQSALWSCQNVMLYMTATTHKTNVNTHLICSDSKDKGKDCVCAFIHHLYEQIKSNDTEVKELIWTEGPSSEFQDNYIIRILTLLRQKE